MTELSSNVFLRTFLNTASSTFDTDSEISIWTSNSDILFSDIRDLEKLVLSIRTDEESQKDTLNKRIDMFKDVLSIDFNTDFRVTTAALKIPMIELWSTTESRDVWIDRTVFNFSKEDAGKTLLIPYDYYLFENPVLFISNDVELVTELDNVIKVNNVAVVPGILPYIEYKI